MSRCNCKSCPIQNFAMGVVQILFLQAEKRARMKGSIICNTFRKLASIVLSPSSTICRWKIAVDGKPSTKHLNVLNQLNYAWRLLLLFCLAHFCSLSLCHLASVPYARFTSRNLLCLLFAVFTVHSIQALLRLCRPLSLSHAHTRIHYTRIPSISCRARSVRFTSS